MSEPTQQPKQPRILKNEHLHEAGPLFDMRLAGLNNYKTRVGKGDFDPLVGGRAQENYILLKYEPHQSNDVTLIENIMSLSPHPIVTTEQDGTFVKHIELNIDSEYFKPLPLAEGEADRMRAIAQEMRLLVHEMRWIVSLHQPEDYELDYEGYEQNLSSILPALDRMCEYPGDVKDLDDNISSISTAMHALDGRLSSKGRMAQYVENEIDYKRLMHLEDELLQIYANERDLFMHMQELLYYRHAEDAFAKQQAEEKKLELKSGTDIDVGKIEKMGRNDDFDLGKDESREKK